MIRMRHASIVGVVGLIPVLIGGWKLFSLAGHQPMEFVAGETARIQVEEPTRLVVWVYTDSAGDAWDGWSLEVPEEFEVSASFAGQEIPVKKSRGTTVTTMGENERVSLSAVSADSPGEYAIVVNGLPAEYRLALTARNESMVALGAMGWILGGFMIFGISGVLAIVALIQKGK